MVSIAIILFLNIPSIVLALDLSAKDINDIKYQLRIVGINSYCSDNIITYMKNLSLSREELLVIEKECTEVINLSLIHI